MTRGGKKIQKLSVISEMFKKIPYMRGKPERKSTKGKLLQLERKRKMYRVEGGKIQHQRKDKPNKRALAHVRHLVSEMSQVHSGWSGCYTGN